MAAPEQDARGSVPDEHVDPATPPEHRLDRLVDRAVAAEFETGRREETEAEAKRHLLVRVARVSAGVVVLLLGVAMLALPGPGLFVIALGLGLLATDVPFAARLLENVRGRLPQDEDGKLPRSTIAMMVLVCVVAVTASIAFTIYGIPGLPD
jgi:hypothetical protein